MTKLNMNKSLLYAAILGPFGLFYSSITGGYFMTIFTLIFGMVIYEDLGTFSVKWYALILVINLLWAYNATIDYNKKVEKKKDTKKDYFLHPYGIKEDDVSFVGLISDVIIGMPQVVIFYTILFGYYNYITKGFWFY